MVKVLCKQKNPNDLDEDIIVELYYDGYIKSNLDLGLKQLNNDFDQVWFIDGAEGAGKSDLASQLAYYVNPYETRHTLGERICTTAESFDNAILNATRFDAVVLDESFGAMSSSGSLNKINRVLQTRFTEIRSKNLFIFILAPSFMDIMRYFAIWRSKCLLHVYLGHGHQRGRCAFFGSKKKRKLYIVGKKKFYDYSCVSPNFVFRFIKQMHKVIDVQKYKVKKDNIQSSGLNADTKENIKYKSVEYYKEICTKILKNDKNITNKGVHDLTGIPLRQISTILKEIKLKSLENDLN